MSSMNTKVLLIIYLVNKSNWKPNSKTRGLEKWPTALPLHLKMIYVTSSREKKIHSKDRVLFQLNFAAHSSISLVTQEWLQHKYQQIFILQLCSDLAFIRNFDWLVNWSWFCFHSPEASLFSLCYLLMRAWCIGRKAGGMEERRKQKDKESSWKNYSTKNRM